MAFPLAKGFQRIIHEFSANSETLRSRQPG
ncbi:hypothetical protein M2275_007751 [Rhodococcus opacus]|nr:hypothetical protein [Rhodococcus opacus]